ncbi:uncharacterized protein LOC121242393 [Juglans microcarpa x Juglans regia]|uniref:uncharacterized protein LOC121242393 n=1 Tax=Juglans microcarpa x Juglans regia TaxID=2249226 RepID=UPI001B7DF909|nr:uncharacterized protein LOC121242393 [Juglans microcarpa x Juglans regia]
MTENTKLTQLQEGLNTLKKTSETQFKSIEAEMQGLRQQMTAMLLELQKNNNSQDKGDSSAGNQFNHEQPLIGGEVQTRSIRLAFPAFDGTDPNGWIYRVNQFFLFHNTLPQHRLRLVSFHMEGKALTWFQDLDESGMLADWETFIKALLIRFGPNCYDDPMQAFTRLKQTGSVKEYKTQFETLSNRFRGLSDHYKLSCFLSGLKDEFWLTVRMFHPHNLITAYSLAKIQEENIALNKKTNCWNPPNPPYSTEPGLLKLSKNTLPVQRINQLQMKDRREKGLCYYCGAKWQPDHRCQKPKLYLIEEICDNPEEVKGQKGEDKLKEVVDYIVTLEPSNYNPEISLHAIMGAANSRTMRVMATIGACVLVVLIDTCSTHNFLDPGALCKTKLHCDSKAKVVVKVANGAVVESEGMISNMSLSIQGSLFDTGAYILSLAGCDMVLGVSWLQTLGTVHWNFQHLHMQFTHAGKEVLLKGLDNPKVMQEGTLPGSSSKENRGVLLQFMEETIPKPTQPICPEIQNLLQHFQDIFSKPKTLPPRRSHDHSIILQPDTKPISADGSWRLCVDYRALNSVTVKDKYPIPVVDELLDELNGSTVFSRLDLRFGYHQIRVNPADIPKTAFLYSRDMEQYLQHLRITLETLRQHELFAKLSKCSFGSPEVSYLGHFISAQGVKVDPEKLKAMEDWPRPTSLKALRGFLGLIGYYRHFIRGYGGVVAALTCLLKKDGFKWNPEAEEAFLKLKQAIMNPPVLALPDFSQPFTIECDASGKAVGVVLLQKGHPIAFYSQALKARALNMSTYEKELLALVSAMQKWRHYLLGSRFTVKTDHQSLKFLLD